MPRRRSAPRRRANRSRNAHFEKYVIRSLVSPASTISVSNKHLPSSWPNRGFTITSIAIHAVAYDSATANKLVVQPTFLQLRILDPNVVMKDSAADDVQRVLWSSVPALFSVMGGRRNYRFPKVRFPIAYSGIIFAVDCLCPQTGWEGGAAVTITVSATLGNIVRDEACVQLTSHPTDAPPDFTVV